MGELDISDRACGEKLWLIFGSYYYVIE